MNFVSGLPVLFGFAMYTGGPKAAFANWTMVGGYVHTTEASYKMPCHHEPLPPLIHQEDCVMTDL